MKSPLIGKFVIVRCHDAGVHAGVLVDNDGREAIIKDSRRLWYWKPANGKKFLDGVSVAGLDESSKVSCVVACRHLTETCEFILCTDEAAESIRSAREDVSR
jgi:hypothetical protein